jgi:hypothetical protein
MQNATSSLEVFAIAVRPVVLEPDEIQQGTFRVWNSILKKVKPLSPLEIELMAIADEMKELHG